MSRLGILMFSVTLFCAASEHSVGGLKVDKRCYCYDMSPQHKVPIFLGIYYIDSQYQLPANDSSTSSTEDPPSFRLKPKYLGASFLNMNKSH